MAAPLAPLACGGAGCRVRAGRAPHACCGCWSWREIEVGCGWDVRSHVRSDGCSDGAGAEVGRSEAVAWRRINLSVADCGGAAPGGDRCGCGGATAGCCGCGGDKDTDGGGGGNGGRSTAPWLRRPSCLEEEEAEEG